MSLPTIALSLACCTAFAVSAIPARALDTEDASVENAAASPAIPNAVEKRLVSLGEALAASNAELELLREQHAQLKLQMEALGVAALNGDEKSLRQRLVSAASDLDNSEKARAELKESSQRLAEAAAAYMAKPAEAALKTGLEEAVKALALTKQSAQSDAVSLDAARVVSYKAELGLAVVNAGRDSGVRMGAPMHIVRADRSVASGLVVDVRNRVAGILLTGASPPQVRVGDSVKPELTQKSPNK